MSFHPNQKQRRWSLLCIFYASYMFRISFARSPLVSVNNRGQHQTFYKRFISNNKIVSSRTSIRLHRTFNIRGGSAIYLAEDQVDKMNKGNKLSNVSPSSNSSSFSTADILNSQNYSVYVAVGSNMGDRFTNIMTALSHLEGIDDGKSVQIIKTSFLHETAPMYVTDQESFLNGMIKIKTSLSPHSLLHKLKEIEAKVGRLLDGPRYGPRPVDLDIIFYTKENNDVNNEDEKVSMKKGDDDQQNMIWTSSGLVLNTDDLVIPHPRIQEREFVLLPMCDLDENKVHPVLKKTIRDIMQDMTSNHDFDETSHSVSPSFAAIPVLPLPRGRMLKFDEVVVMGILNVTPDSFSDGGKFQGSIEKATQEALNMISDGAGIIDIGGESTRPGAKEVMIDEELQRTIPIIKSIRQVSDIPISIDTRHARVAYEAIIAGADIVNDVSGGTFDPEMLSTVAKLKVPIILMHMKGTPETMQTMTDYDDVVSEVANSLLERMYMAEKAGIPRWLQVVDPGIGFAKDLHGNLSLIKNFGTLRNMVNHMPILLGPSRKGFIGKITGEMKPEERDFGTAAACLVALNNEFNAFGNSSRIHKQCSIVRVHNVKGVKQAMMIMEALNKAK